MPSSTCRFCFKASSSDYYLEFASPANLKTYSSWRTICFQSLGDWTVSWEPQYNWVKQQTRKWTKAGGTLRSSRAVPHPSTNRVLRHLTSEVGRDPVHSTRYGRQRCWICMADTMNTRRTKRKDICQPQDRALAINGQNFLENTENLRRQRVR